LGGGPNRIGQGIEFDYCCVHACFALADAGYETIMVNCNPETVSTDYDTSDRLYFEPLTAEDVLEILHVEQQNGTLKGVIVQFGGQTPLNLAKALEAAGIPILGTSPDAIDLAEDRERFAALINKLKLKQPENGIARSREEAIKVAETIGYPVLMRPSYVLGGRAMEIVDTQAQLENYIQTAVIVSGDSPVLIDSYLRDAI
jgi:carbamoyl-phosphate synthase large subunit